VLRRRPADSPSSGGESALDRFAISRGSRTNRRVT
jgi:hypothetical protein